jgi:hypothetical protein
VTRRFIAALLVCAVAGPAAVAAAQEPTTSAPAPTTAVPGITPGDPGAAPTATAPPATATAPSATTTAAPTPPATTTAAPAPAARDTGPDAGDRAAVLLLVIFGGLFVLAAVLWALARWQAWDPPWLVRWRHATGEAGWRAGNAWAEFTDWLRLGR